MIRLSEQIRGLTSVAASGQLLSVQTVGQPLYDTMLNLFRCGASSLPDCPPRLAEIEWPNPATVKTSSQMVEWLQIVAYDLEKFGL